MAEQQRAQERRARQVDDAQAASQRTAPTTDSDGTPKKSGADQKKEEMDKAKAPTQPDAKTFHREGERSVLDPVTKQQVIIKDAELKGE